MVMMVMIVVVISKLSYEEGNDEFFLIFGRDYKLSSRANGVICNFRGQKQEKKANFFSQIHPYKKSIDDTQNIMSNAAPDTNFVQNVVLSKRNQTYQAVMENPSIWDCTVHTRTQNWFYVAAWTALSGFGGWVYGWPTRKISSRSAALVSLLGGVALCQQDTFLRLKGYRENSQEVAKFGLEPRQLVKITKKRTENIAAKQQEE